MASGHIQYEGRHDRAVNKAIICPTDDAIWMHRSMDATCSVQCLIWWTRRAPKFGASCPVTGAKPGDLELGRQGWAICTREGREWTSKAKDGYTATSDATCTVYEMPRGGWRDTLGRAARQLE